MSKAPKAHYVGRPAGVAPITISIDREALTLLRELSPTRKSYGHFLARLIFEHQARQEERQRMQQPAVVSE